MIELTYVLKEKTANLLHRHLSITPVREKYVGIFGQKKYTSLVTESQTSTILELSENVYRLFLRRDTQDISVEEEGNLLEVIKTYFLSKSIVLDGIEKQYFQEFMCFF